MLSVKADDQSGELAACEDELALAIMAVDEHARRPERDVVGHSVIGRSVSCQLVHTWRNELPTWAS